MFASMQASLFALASEDATNDDDDDDETSDLADEVVLSDASFRMSLERHNRRIEALGRHLDIVQGRFIDVLKCLTILLDKDLIDIAILGSSYVRLVSTYHMHKKLILGGHAEDALERFQELKEDEDAPQPVSEKQEGIDFKKENEKLKKLLYTDDDELMSNRKGLEKTIDTHLESQIKENRTKDLRVLVQWLDELAPTPKAH